MITQDELKHFYIYDPETGHITRRLTRGRWKAGERVGSLNRDGYLRLRIGRPHYMAHRLAWLYQTGGFPENEIDHINGVKHDNRFCNLRAVTRNGNVQNLQRARRDSSTGLIGATETPSGRFEAKIRVNGVYTYLGRFDTAAEAHKVYKMAKRKLHTTCNI